MTSHDWALATSDPRLRKAAQRLAQRAGRPLTTLDDERHDFLLVLTPEGLELRQTGAGAPGPLRPDFCAGRMRQRLRTSGIRAPLARAAGMRGDHRPDILDATAGLGQDAFVLAALGSRLTLLEHSLPVFLLLEDALARATTCSEIAEVASRIRLHHAEAVEWLESHDEAFEVIHLDPMYPPRRKSARSGKGMQMLQRLLGEKEDSETLLEAAIAHARHRVVVKRPARAAPLANRPPDFSIRSPKTRYDIYRGKAE